VGSEVVIQREALGTALLSVCLWKEKHENTWEEIEVCHAYRGHNEKEELVECAWEEVFFQRIGEM
jgi:hypothetical protein